MRRWPDQQIDAITTPAINDVRGRAILRAVDEMIGETPISSFYVRDADTCPAEVLPALVAEYSLHEFVEPSLPEAIVRRIVKHAYFLQRLAGTDAGVLLGLSLLGVDADITQWWQTEPKGPANTHNVQVFVGEKLFEPAADIFLSDREIRAARRMIDACKRFSQQTFMRTGVALRLPSRRVAARIHGATVHHLKGRIVQRAYRPTLRARSDQVISGATIVSATARIVQRPYTLKLNNGQSGRVSGATVVTPSRSS